MASKEECESLSTVIAHDEGDVDDEELLLLLLALEEDLLQPSQKWSAAPTSAAHAVAGWSTICVVW